VGNRRAIWTATLAGALTTAAAALAFAGQNDKASNSVQITGTSAKTGAACKAGSKAISGGFRAPHSTESPAFVKQSLRRAGRRWSAGVQRFDPGGTLTVYAYCGDEKVKTKQRAKQISVDEQTTVRVRCPRGQTPISGGFSAAPAGPPYPTASRRAGTRRWAATFVSFNTGLQGRAQVNCFDGPPLGKRVKTKSVSPPDEFRLFTVTAKCSRGETAVSGGFRILPPLSKPGPFVNSSRRSGKRKWTVEVVTGFRPGKLTAYAYCA
jgi:hypothetical protein